MVSPVIQSFCTRRRALSSAVVSAGAVRLSGSASRESSSAGSGSPSTPSSDSPFPATARVSTAPPATASSVASSDAIPSPAPSARVVSIDSPRAFPTATTISSRCPGSTASIESACSRKVGELAIGCTPGAAMESPRATDLCSNDSAKVRSIRGASTSRSSPTSCASPRASTSRISPSGTVAKITSPESEYSWLWIAAEPRSSSVSSVPRCSASSATARISSS